jgi:hypothetical protein
MGPALCKQVHRSFVAGLLRMTISLGSLGAEQLPQKQKLTTKDTKEHEGVSECETVIESVDFSTLLGMTISAVIAGSTTPSAINQISTEKEFRREIGAHQRRQRDGLGQQLGFRLPRPHRLVNCHHGKPEFCAGAELR